MATRHPKTKATLGSVVGYWADERVPDLGKLLVRYKGHEQTFVAWLGPRLAEYRGSLDVDAQLPTEVEERRCLDKLIADLGTAERVLRPLSETPVIAARLHAAAFRRDTNWLELKRVTHLNVVQLQLIALAVKNALPPADVPKGRPRSVGPRDRLVTDAVTKLKALAPALPLKVHQLTAQEVLVACGVHGLSDIKRSTRKGQK